MDNVTLSVCMIVRDEEPVLERCLQGVAVFADEIILVDTGSKDGTRRIAERFTNHIYDFPWIDDFAAARNFSYSHATADYIMWLDADDVIEPADGARLRELKRTLPRETDVVYLLYRDGDGGDQVNIYNNSALLRDRWIRRELGLQWEGRVNEVLPLSSDMREFYAEDIVIRHQKLHVNDPGRNLRIYRSCIDEKTDLTSLDQSYLCAEHYLLGEYREAVVAFDGLARFPFNVGAYANALWYYIGSQKALGNTGELIAVLEALYQKGLTGELLTCELGGAYLREKRYGEAEHWLKLALDTPVDYRDLTRHFDAYHVFLPCQKLCKLYAAKGDRTAAYDYHLRSAAVYPVNPVVLRNELCFRMKWNENAAHACVSMPCLV